MEAECEVQIGDGPDAYVKRFDSFVDNFLKMIASGAGQIDVSVVDTSGVTQSTAGVKCVYTAHANHNNYSEYISWG